MRVNPIQNFVNRCFYLINAVYFDRIDVSEGN